MHVNAIYYKAAEHLEAIVKVVLGLSTVAHVYISKQKNYGVDRPVIFCIVLLDAGSNKRLHERPHVANHQPREPYSRRRTNNRKAMEGHGKVHICKYNALNAGAGWTITSNVDRDGTDGTIDCQHAMPTTTNNTKHQPWLFPASRSLSQKLPDSSKAVLTVPFWKGTNKVRLVPSQRHAPNRSLSQPLALS